MALTVQISNPPLGTKITTSYLQDLIELLRPRFSLGGSDSTTVDNSFAQAATPSTAQQGLTWIRLSNDISGKPLGTYRYYQGRWCRVYSTPVGVLMHTRIDPTPYFNLTTGLGLFDGGTTGLAGEWYGWRYHSGTSGTNLRDRFLISANKYDPAINLWVTKLTDGTFIERGGRTGENITADEIPSLPITGKVYDSGATDGPARVVMSTKTSGDDLVSDISTSGYINAAETNLNAYPPFIAAALIEFIGYTYLDPTIALP